MPGVRDLLYRFRPAGSPGPASAAAVPADRVADRTTELEPVFALLADTEERCASLREEAERAAAARRERAREAARRSVADAETGAAQERARSAATVADRAVGESAATVEQARAEADRLLARARVRTPDWAARVASHVEEVLEGAPEGTAR